MKYRISLGLDLSVWNNAHTDRLTGTVLSNEEASTFSIDPPTAIFYTENPDDVIMKLMVDGFSLTDFRWINISEE